MNIDQVIAKVRGLRALSNSTNVHEAIDARLASGRARIDAYLAGPRPPPMLPDDSWFDDSPADPIADRFGHSESLTRGPGGGL